MHVGVAESRERIVEPHAGPQLPGRHAPASKHREQEAQRAHQVGRDGEQHPPLARCFQHQTEIEVLEIAQAAVDQPRRTGARASAEIAGVHQRGTETAQGRVARDAPARDPAADHEQVHRLRLHRLQRRGAGAV